MKFKDIISLGIKKLKHGRNQSIYLFMVLTVAMSIMFGIILCVNGTNNMLKSGLLPDYLANRSISWKEFKNQNNQLPNNIEEITNNYDKSKLNNLYTAQKYNIDGDKFLGLDINFPNKPFEKSNLSVVSFLDDELFKNQIGGKEYKI